MTWLQRIFRRRNMTPISRRLRFDANLFDSRVPPESRFLSRFESDYPFFIQDNLLPTETCDRIVRDLLAGGSRGKLAVKPNGAETSLLDRKMRDTDFLP